MGWGAARQSDSMERSKASRKYMRIANNLTLTRENSGLWSRTLALGLAALAVGLALKLALIARGSVPFNADEAVVALMARHILAGSRPVFFYGQAYMGSLDAYLVAAGFALAGEQVWVIRAVQTALYLGTIGTTIALGKAAFGSWRVGVAAGWLLAIPSVNVALYTTASLGNYGEALLLGNGLLLLTLHMVRLRHKAVPWGYWLGWGLLAGVGVWAFGLTLVYTLPAGVLLAWDAARRWRASAVDWRPGLALPAGLTLAGMLLGASPWLRYAQANGFDRLLWELGGGAVAGVAGGTWAQQLAGHAVNLLVLGSPAIFGLRPPWEVRWLAWPLLPIAVGFWLAVLASLVRWRRAEARQAGPGAGLLLGIMGTLVIGFLLTPFGADPSGRYFLPLAIPLSLFAGVLVVRLSDSGKRWIWGVFALVLAFHLWGTIDSARRVPPGLTTQFDVVAQVDHRHMPQLIRFLESHGERRGYTNYWVTYPLAFRSRERLIYVPHLPYHPDFRYTRRDDRYPPYTEAVADAGRVAYITTHHPALDERLRAEFSALGLSWEEAQIGDYHVFFALSRAVRPAELGLGETTP